jgi:crotonobetainyl-CoA hydratase/dehydration protein DpgD
MEYDNSRPGVVYEKKGHVAYVTLDRPEALNALDLRTHERLAAIWDDFERDDEMRIGVLAGRGTRAFSVGQDLKELARRNEAGAPPSSFGSRGLPGYPRLTERFALSKPVVARVCGHAVGGGFELALACDIIVAADNASFALPEARLGLIPGAGGLFRLPRQVPVKIAMGHLMTGRPITAARAYELGLVNEVAPLDEIDACVDRWVQDLLRCAPLSLRAIKEAHAASAHQSVEQAFQGEYRWETARRHSADCQEGPRAFAEKRPPRWRGA